MLSRQNKKNTILTLFIQCGAISFLLLLSILIVACSGNGSSQLDPGTPVVTVTINLGQVIGSPTPTLSPYYCGGWATDTSPPFSSTSTVSVFGKVTRTVTVDGNSNPEGVNGATATATIQWPDGTTETKSVTTTSDGLAVFPVAIKASAVNKLVTIMISFTSPQGVQLCTIPSAAYFTAILISPTPTNTAVPSPTGSPTGSPTPGGTVTPTGTPRVTPTPSPTKHP
jgi:stage V sporulation protein SpoVS